MSRVIVALDFETSTEALTFVRRLDPKLCRLKVGSTLFTRAGPALIDALQAKGFEIFLDLKFLDIPHQVAGACRVAADLGIWMVDCHASGGLRMLTAAAEALATFRSRPLLIAVTVLTSFGLSDLEEIGISREIPDQVRQLLRLSDQAGCDGIVCSAAELQVLASELPKDFVTVTPGIRLAGDALDDQRRVVTPAEAYALGARYVVIGRSITRADDPQAALLAAQPATS